MTLADVHRHLGGRLAPDGIPLDYGDLQAEYRAALEAAVLMDRSHEGRIEGAGRDRLALIQRMSTNDVLALAENEGCPTIFTTPVGRIIDRIIVYHRGDTALLLTDAGRGGAVQQYLQRNIFFNDEARYTDLAPSTRQLVLHGPNAAAVVTALAPDLPALLEMHSASITVGDTSVVIARTKPVSGTAWVIIAANDSAAAVWNAVLATGRSHGLLPAGSLTYNLLRIRAGRPGAGREASADFIPLEVGLWDEVSFSKGCYTGQEILARMESRGRLAKTIVSLRLDRFVEAPAPLLKDEREVGRLTSSVTTPDGDSLGIGVVRLAAAQPGAVLDAGGVQAIISGLVGAQPPALRSEAGE